MRLGALVCPDVRIRSIHTGASFVVELHVRRLARAFSGSPDYYRNLAWAGANSVLVATWYKLATDCKNRWQMNKCIQLTAHDEVSVVVPNRNGVFGLMNRALSLAVMPTSREYRLR